MLKITKENIDSVLHSLVVAIWELPQELQDYLTNKKGNPRVNLGWILYVYAYAVQDGVLDKENFRRTIQDAHDSEFKGVRQGDYLVS